MKEYNYTDIVKLYNRGIEFYDGNYIKFEVCKYEWAKEKGISVDDTVCVAIRTQENNQRYFIFYSSEKIRINFNFDGLFKNRKSKEKYCEMQMMLEKFGYSSYDMT